MEEQIQNELIKLGKRIRFLRKKKKITQIDLELATGVNNADISRIENGNKNIELITLIKIAIALKVTIKELFEYETEHD